MRITLAPMEGVIDHTMRTLLTALGGIDRCVTEFVRVTDERLPKRTFYRLCPELLQGGVTPSGVPVYVQLLGGKPAPMAANAKRAAALGAPGIDINFGCPAKIVNRHDGGSILLRDPERIYQIVGSVRDAVPAAIPVTAKIRLGYDHPDLVTAVAEAAENAGASELIVHARTKQDGYKPPAHWHLLEPVRRRLKIPVFANGEIWSPADADKCRAASHCDDIMLGRGVLARPDLPRLVRAHIIEGKTLAPMAWPEVVELLLIQFEACLEHYPPQYAGNPIKQWLGYLRRHYVEAAVFFEGIKRLREVGELQAALLGEMDQSHLTQSAVGVALGAGVVRDFVFKA
jgi:tRNA-dihydrouridine synthase C